MWRSNLKKKRRTKNEKTADSLYSWANGNTERIAKKLQSVAGGDLLKIDTAVPYSGSYDDVVDQGQREVERGFEPELKPLNVSIAGYDIVAVGTPTWWYTMAPAVIYRIMADLRKMTVRFFTPSFFAGCLLLLSLQE